MGRRGFTLIELLVVVVIIGILASVAMPSFISAQDRARNAAMISNTKAVVTALELYAGDNRGNYPPSITDPAFLASKALPGGKLPKAPWCSEPQDTDGGAAVQVIMSTYWEDIKALAIDKKHFSSSLTGMMGAARAKPTAYNHFGMLMYAYDAENAVYHLATTGKDNKTIRMLSPQSNEGNQ
jgi:type II secretion system protein G